MDIYLADIESVDDIYKFTKNICYDDKSLSIAEGITHSIAIHVPVSLDVSGFNSSYATSIDSLSISVEKDSDLEALEMSNKIIYEYDSFESGGIVW